MMSLLKGESESWGDPCDLIQLHLVLAAQTTGATDCNHSPQFSSTSLKATSLKLVQRTLLFLTQLYLPIGGEMPSIYSYCKEKI